MDVPMPATPTPASVTVRRGDTLVGLVKAHYRGQGVTVDDREAFRMALRVARGNGIADASRIQPGQTIRLEGLPLAADLAADTATPGSGAPTAAAPTGAAPPTSRASAGLSTASSTGSGVTAPAATADVLASRRAADPIFERTLARAVERGFIPAAEADAVRERVGRMARDYGFDPDDFARVVLIESDGMNPSATNGRCHGIIQFCGGPGRGAASVGFASNAQDIGKLSVLQQLDLVDRYFQDVGMPRAGTRMSLDDLYLSVLTPAARALRASDAPLPIAGVQARVLYEGGQRDAPITRRSITQGLLRYAQERLSDVTGQLPTGPNASAGGSNWPGQRQIVAANSVERP